MSYRREQACTISTTGAVKQASLTDVAHFPKQDLKMLRKFESYLHLHPADAFPACLVIHVFAAVLVVIIVPAAVAVPLSTIFLISCSHEAPLSRVEAPAPYSPATRLDPAHCSLYCVD